ncbi:MAG: hypothetical protein ACRD0G_03070 [Acidimicrobiales bacterium]
MDLDWRAIGIGAAVALAVAVPVNAVGAALLDEDSGWVFAFALVGLAGFAAGGFVAASKRPDTPLTHGAVAAAVAYLLAQAVAVVVNLASDDDVNVVAIVASALLAASFGLLGGLVADRLAARADR